MSSEFENIGDFHDLGYAKVDISRGERTGFSEVIYGEGKTVDQLVGIIKSLLKNNINVLATRISVDKYSHLKDAFPQGEYFENCRLFKIISKIEKANDSGYILIACAGTSDIPIAEEAAITAEFFGNRVVRLYDAGVAGIHRLLSNIKILEEARVIVAVAGMEGALPSVIGGLVKAPVIAVPTSIGYGANFGGLAALLGMLNSCASGVSVVNIDNGFGAGFLASKINNL
ncbi:MAG: nickel pincer cofactor biosynthesis protein LarB [Filifactoraceae bacterium]